MGNGFQFLDIILFAMVAAFLVLRLRNVLGKKTGHQRQRQNPFAQRSQEMNEDSVVELPNRRAKDDDADFEDDGEAAAGAHHPEAGEEPGDDRLAAGIERIRRADGSFHPGVFLEGANGAFEMIVRAFSAGELERLEPLLAEDVFEQFREAVEERARANEILETEIAGPVSSGIIEADMVGPDAVVTVRFQSDQINVTRDADNRIVDGDPNDVTEIEDIWTFRRDTRSADPNWKLVETGTRQ